VTEPDTLEELMAEPPHGENAGWERNSVGGWSSLETGEHHQPHRQVFVDTPRVHGFAYGYVDMKCRCVECRAWKSVYDSERRRYD
jgi:hypothetical protein